MAKRKFQKGDRFRIKAGPNSYAYPWNGQEGTVRRYNANTWDTVGWYDAQMDSGAVMAFYPAQMEKIIPPPDLGHIW